MFFLLFFIALIQFFAYWIFGPITSFITNLLEIKLFPIFALVALILIFSAKNIENK